MYYNGARLLSKLLLQVKKTFIIITNVKRVKAKRKLLKEIRIANEVLMNKPQEPVAEQSVLVEVTPRHCLFAIEFSLN